MPGVNLLSDSVAISLQYDEELPPKGRYKNYLAWLACESTLKVLDRFRRDNPALVLRGCITYSEHISEGNFIVGPAVDDAAEGMDIGRGAFVWLHPTAADKYRQCIKTTEATVEKLNGTQEPEQILDCYCPRFSARRKLTFTICRRAVSNLRQKLSINCADDQASS